VSSLQAAMKRSSAALLTPAIKALLLSLATRTLAPRLVPEGGLRISCWLRTPEQSLANFHEKAHFVKPTWRPSGRMQRLSALRPMLPSAVNTLQVVGLIAAAIALRRAGASLGSFILLILVGVFLMGGHPFPGVPLSSGVSSWPLRGSKHATAEVPRRSFLRVGVDKGSSLTWL
jgi:hypothetical protein